MFFKSFTKKIIFSFLLVHFVDVSIDTHASMASNNNYSTNTLNESQKEINDRSADKNIQLYNNLLYSLEDLKVLSNEKNFNEFFKHANDIRPNQRNLEWNKLVSDMGIALIQSNLGKNYISTQLLETIEELTLWPLFKNDSIFLLMREQYGLKYITSCYKNASQKTNSGNDSSTAFISIDKTVTAPKFPNNSNSSNLINIKKDECLAILKLFWKNTPNSPTKGDLGIKLGDLVEELQLGLAGIDSWYFYKEAMNSSVSSLLCKHTNVKKALFTKVATIIESELFSLNNNKLNIEKFLSLANQDCWNNLFEDIKDASLVGGNSQSKYISYFVLKNFKKLNEQENIQMLVLYFLSNPTPGEMFNISWNIIEELGRSYEKRTNVINFLKKLDPLPDDFLSSKDLKKVKVLLMHLAENIPEYLDMYANTCYEYYSGKVNFQNGNPTINCKEFLTLLNSDKNLIKNGPIINKGLQEKLAGLILNISNSNHIKSK